MCGKMGLTVFSRSSVAASPWGHRGTAGVIPAPSVQSGRVHLEKLERQAARRGAAGGSPRLRTEVCGQGASRCGCSTGGSEVREEGRGSGGCSSWIQLLGAHCENLFQLRAH